MKDSIFRHLTILTTVLIFGSNISLFAQIKVGDNPTTLNPDALLEIETTDKGLLLPRVALTSTTDAAPLSAHVQGMIVYNTADVPASGDVTPGYYYNDGTHWVRLAGDNSIANEWMITGNAGTDEASDFIGTTDAVAFVTRTDNTERMRVTSTGNVGIGSASPTEKLQVDGNINFSGALMPDNQAGTVGQALLSGGAGAPPTWGSPIAAFGDVKTGIQVTDHSGWVKLDGRLTADLTATQQVQATAIGFGTNLPNLETGESITTILTGQNIGNGGLADIIKRRWKSNIQYEIFETNTVDNVHTYTFPEPFIQLPVAAGVMDNISIARMVVTNISTTSIVFRGRSDTGGTTTAPARIIVRGQATSSDEIGNVFIYLGL